MSLELGAKLIGQLPQYISLKQPISEHSINYPLIVRIWQKFHQRNEKYRQIFENAVIGMFQATKSGHFIAANPALAKIYGYETTQQLTDNLKNLKLHRYVDPHRHQALINLLQEQEVVRGFESEITRLDGSRIWISETVKLTYNAYGIPVGYEGSIEEITERKQAEFRLQEALEKEKKASQLNAQFASMISHELKNSLTIIAASADLLKLHSQKMAPHEKQSRFDKIGTTIRNMSAMIDGVLAIGKAEAGKLKFEPVQLEIQPFFQDIWQDIQVMTKAQHTLKISSRDSKSMVVETDLRIFRQIFINLLLNAVKYSPDASGVECEITYEQNQAIFRIKDEGIGICEEDQKHLFEEFHRGKNTTSFEGTGLGLSIVKKALELHGGSLSFESHIGVGSIFTIHLPQASPPSLTAFNGNIQKHLLCIPRPENITNENAIPQIPHIRD
ncbi:PAS domain-containing sensor histidine kinase [Ancylothrix sp. C2]|uniref:PAS domain-containing sensor histidine kinase n=1 Tax=Ancylothrix sp. D3o TaxID=2953691 RepID=UPI0021BBB0B2|nr:PAS domain-containing sensor histidine kinase [Ancylothrix sp. D3o]MCT7949854.1 PAS domain-containing sensor histidine kinase [Ancylothrix sp. D3o]